MIVSSPSETRRHSPYEGAVLVRDLGALANAGTTTLTQQTMSQFITASLAGATAHTLVLPLMPRGAEITIQLTLAATTSTLDIQETLPSGVAAALQTRATGGASQNFAARTASGGNADATRVGSFAGATGRFTILVNNTAAGTYALTLKKVFEYVQAATNADGWVVSNFVRVF